MDDLSKLDIGCQLITAFGNMTGDKSTFRLKLENVLNPVEILFLKQQMQNLELLKGLKC